MTASREVPAQRTPVQDETLPAGLISVAVGKGCLLVLTATEYAQGIRRGKWWRRRTALAKRTGARS